MKVANFADFVYDDSKAYCLVDYTDLFTYQNLHSGKIIINVIEPLSVDDIIELFIDSICTFKSEYIDDGYSLHYETWKEKNV